MGRVARGDQLAVGVKRLSAGALRADVDSHDKRAVPAQCSLLGSDPGAVAQTVNEKASAR